MTQPKGHSTRAFTMVELLAIVVTIAALATLLVPTLAKSQSQSHTTIDISNVRQILKGVHLYSADNTDFCPHPTWGTGITGWLHSAGIRPATVSSAAQLPAAISNQLTFFRKGQLAPYVNNNQSIFDCPTDVAMRRQGQFQVLYFRRELKLSSYNFTGAISGYGTPRQLANADAGGTYKLSTFAPSAFIMWELDETSLFNFNDAAINQENANEGQSRRHTSSPTRSSPIVPQNGLGMVGRFGGEASFIKLGTMQTLRTTPPENDLRCGPGYR
jgi:hypothetical protein